MPAPFEPNSPTLAIDRLPPSRWWSSRTALIGALYFGLHLAAHLAARGFEIGPGVSLWYPPAGLALAVLVLRGPRFAPVVFAANLVGAWGGNGFGFTWSLVLFPLLITASYSAAAILVRRWNGPRLLPGSPRETAVFIGGAFLASACTAISGTALAALLAPPLPTPALRMAVQWWLGDASGILTVVPAVMVFAGPWVREERTFRMNSSGDWRRLLLVAVQAFALIGSLWLVFACDSLPRAQTFYLCILPLVWICLQHGLPGATLATLAITMGGLIGLRLQAGTLASSTDFLFLELAVAVVGLGLGSTVTRRNVAERRLVANEARFDRVISGAQVGLWEWNLCAQQVVFNQRCVEMLGCAPTDPAPTPETWVQRLSPADSGRVLQLLQRHLEGHSQLFETEYRLCPASGTERWIHTRGSVVARDEQGRPLLMSGTHVDITGRKQAEAEAARLLQVIEATTDFVFTTDVGGRILFANAAALRFVGCAAAGLRGRQLGELLAEGSQATFSAAMEVLSVSGLWSGEIQFPSADGTLVPVSIVALRHLAAEGMADSFSFVLRDISQQRQAEAARLEQERRLLQLQKTESLGVLAGGIAHDFNNLLTTMLGNAGLVRCDLPADSPLHESIEQIETAAHRAADLCQQMLAYAGRRPLADSDVDLNGLIEETQRLFHVSISRKISVDLAFTPTPVVVRAARPQLQQVILNLVINAAEAIGDRAGRIALRTAACTYRRETLHAEFGTDTLPAGRYALCEVEDSGGGIAPEIRRRIFEPFFTTKATGHGLGLAAVHGVVTSHRGAIAVSSEAGRGSTFRFILPLAGTADGAAGAPAAAAPWTGSGLVLVVDDEPGVQRVAAQMLKSFGFSTLAAADGAEAVALFRQHADRLQLVLLDLIMPQMDGVETFGELQRLNAAVPVVLMSGFVGNLNLDRFPAAKPAGLLAKPFSREALQAQLKDVLGRA